MKLKQFLDFYFDHKRRDLTFNAMSMDFEGNLFDYFNGQEDLRAGVVRFVGNARQRVEEDYLRILRYFRFMARFDATGDSAVFEMLLDPAIHQGLSEISVERYWLEMSRLFMAPAGAKVTLLMEGLGITKTIGLPGYMNQWAFLNADDAASKLTAFIPDSFTPADALTWGRNWKLSRDIIDKMVFLVRQRGVNITEPEIEDLLVDGTPRNWVVSWCKTGGYSSKVAEQFDPPVFPVSGSDLIKKGMVEGPAMGQQLKAMRDRWKQSRFRMTKYDLLENLNV